MGFYAGFQKHGYFLRPEHPSSIQTERDRNEHQEARSKMPPVSIVQRFNLGTVLDLWPIPEHRDQLEISVAFIGKWPHLIADPT